MKKLVIAVKDIEAWENFDADSEQANECFKAHVEHSLLSNPNVTCVQRDQSPESIIDAQYDRDTFDFSISVVDGDSEDYESVRDGLEITLNDTIGIEFCVKFSIADIGNHNYQVQMTQTEDTVYA